MILHLYSQAYNHEPALICGTKEELLRLKFTIDKAIQQGQDNCISFTNDGEGYTTFVLCLEEEQMNQLQLPYVDPVVSSDQGKSPWTFLKLHNEID